MGAFLGTDETGRESLYFSHAGNDRAPCLPLIPKEKVKMCLLTSLEKEAVQNILQEQFIKPEEPFTGWDVTKIFRLEYPDHQIQHREISAYIRELFNAGKIPGWGVTNVRPEPGEDGRPKGPLLYLPVEAFFELARWVEQTRKAIEND